MLKSEHIKINENMYCCLVPEPPANIKAAALTADSILISWLAPKHKNGNIQHYTVYSREAGKKGQAKSKQSYSLIQLGASISNINVISNR